MHLCRNPFISRMKNSCVTIFVILFVNTLVSAQLNPQQQEILTTYLNHCAYKHHYLLKDWQKCIDEGLKEDSTIAELWQNKALPYWKTQKYEVALKYYDKAVELDKEEYLGRRGYLKCLFQEDYEGALADLEAAQSTYGNRYENDHTYAFYIALCYLQLNQFEKARTILGNEIASVQKKSGKDFVHYLDYFYLGISYMELEQYDEAIAVFDLSLSGFKQFSDALYYKGVCFLQKKDIANATHFMNLARTYSKIEGNSFNEDANLYERLPYQVHWGMAQHTIPKQ